MAHDVGCQTHRRPDRANNSAHLCASIQLQQAPTEGGACVVVLELGKSGHGAAQRESHMLPLQVGVCEVGCQLSCPLDITQALLAFQLCPQCYVVLSAGTHSVS